MPDPQIVVVDFRGPPGLAGAPGAWTPIAASQGVLVGTRYGVDTTAAPVTLTLPALSLQQPGWEIAVCDLGGRANVNAIIFAPTGGDQINNAAPNVNFTTARGICRAVVNAAKSSWELILG